MIPFNKPYMTGNELSHIGEAYRNCVLAGDGPFTKRCHEWLETRTGACRALLTHSCTAALEMAAILLDIAKGDEIIMPSFTFVSTANAFVMRGGVPVFVDIRSDTLNLDERRIEEAITARTKAIVVVHYAGVACQMDVILAIAEKHGLPVIEDAAQGVMATFRGSPLGSLGALGAYSFHETKNLTCGEGGALLVNQKRYQLRAEICREKGTDRSSFFRGEIAKYVWRDVGSSYLLGEISAAFLWAQFNDSQRITSTRRESWNHYYRLLAPLEAAGWLRRPIVPSDCDHNAHLFYIVLRPGVDQQKVLAGLKEHGVGAVFHYQPLHSSPAGARFGRACGSMAVTDNAASQLIRLPFWMEISQAVQEQVVVALAKVLENHAGKS
jgi:dTDP-4-amino-4,6-dideoxygalactose transaminase